MNLGYFEKVSTKYPTNMNYELN